LTARGLGRLRRVAGRLGGRSDGEALILLYHRVDTLKSDPWGLAVTPGRFAEHLEVLRQHARPMQLRELSQGLRDGRLPERSVVVTFDDGYADNLHNAKPLLERHDIPATVFVASGFVGHKGEFWWDELGRLLLRPGVLPGILRLSVDGNMHRWELGAAAHYTVEEFRRHRGWRAWKVSPTPRHSLYISLCDLLRPISEAERQGKLNELRGWVVAAPERRPNHRPLSPREIGKLDQGGLVEVGAHTVTHPVLSALPQVSQRSEIAESKACLEKVSDYPVTSFAYPYGKPRDYTAETVDIVRRAGFGCACSTFAGVVGRSSDRFQLPRVFVRNWDGDRLAQRLGTWFDGERACIRGR
jgi:peptidoglycan/xylan/chitin deacetylase (PgdA/CDA1 family)